MGGDPDAIRQYLHEHLWHRYHTLRRPWLREIEETMRALAGHQYDAYIESLGEWVDLSALYVPQDERWRRAPVFNWLAQVWFPVMLSKFTENVPVLGAQPRTSDQRDAKLAQLFDPIFRYEWNQMGMPELLFRLYGWVVAAGRGVVKLRWDPSRGDLEPFTGPATLQLPDGTGQVLSDAPYILGPDGNPQLHVTTGPDGQPTLGPPQLLRHGDLAAQVLSPASFLMPYGPEPVSQKPWVMHRYPMHVDEIAARWGVAVEPDATLGENDTILRMDYTSPYGNSASPMVNVGWWLSTAQPVALEGMAWVTEYWARGCYSDPHGRLTITTTAALLDDGPNPYYTPTRGKVVVPFYVFDRVALPFRQEGSSDAEGLKPIVRARNRTLGGLMDAADFNEQPTKLINRNLVGDDQDQNFNTRGGHVYVDGDPRAAATFLQPPPLPATGTEMAKLLLAEANLLGHISLGATGNAVTDDASGELQREVRFDADRPDGATLRLHSYEWARLAGGVFDILAVCLPAPRLLTLAGEDQATTFLSVEPELLEADIEITPSVESAVLETRQDKQNRLVQALTAASTMPPPYGQILLKNLGYPDLVRAMQPNAEATALARRQIAEMWTTGQTAPVFPEQDHAAHLAEVTAFMQTQAYRDGTDAQRQALLTYKAFHEHAAVVEQLRQSEIAANVQGERMVQAQQVATQVQAQTPPPVLPPHVQQQLATAHAHASQLQHAAGGHGPPLPPPPGAAGPPPGPPLALVS